MDIYWGEPKKSNKRRYEDDDYPDYDEPVGTITKKIKLFKDVNKMIYSIKNEVHFTDTITNQTIENVIKIVTKLINKNSSKYEGVDVNDPATEKCNIVFVIDSPGGSVSAILKFVDFIRMTKEKYPWLEYTSVVTGTVCSAGTIFAISCDHRFMTKHSKYMVHELSTGRSGKYTHLQSYMDHVIDLHNTLVDIYFEKCNKTRQEIEILLGKETWYNSEQCLANGFIDKII